MSLARNLRIFMADDSDLSPSDLEFKQLYMDHSVFDDNEPMPPVVVLSQINPINTVPFLVHLVLSMGNYVTKKEAFSHGSIRQCLVATKLIGSNTDETSKRTYLNDLLRRYILEQLIYYPISLLKVQHFILRIRDIFAEVLSLW
jgi:hypothetical protein